MYYKFKEEDLDFINAFTDDRRFLYLTLMIYEMRQQTSRIMALHGYTKDLKYPVNNTPISIVRMTPCDILSNEHPVKYVTPVHDEIHLALF